MKVKYINQRGFAVVFEVVLVSLVLLIIGGIGFAAYKARITKSTNEQTLHGNISQNDCSKVDSGCFDHTLNSDAGKTYGLVGSVDVKPHIGKEVTIKGTIRPSSPADVINVVTVEPDAATNTTGTLSISVTCMQTIDPEPCPTSVKIENQSSAQVNSTPYIATDSNGKLSVSLAPGSYLLTPEPKTKYPYVAYPQSNPVTVRAGQTTSIDINYHDGTK